MASIWRQDASLPAFPSLEGDTSAEVLVIGGGLAGLLCARALTDAGAECVLIEQGRLCGGATANTTAKITVQHGLLYAKLIKRFGVRRAKMYLQANQAALERYRTLCRDIDCDFETRPSAVYSRRDRGAIREEQAALEALGCPARLVRNLPLPFPVAGAVEVPDQAQFHPLRFAAAMVDGLRIYEHTRALTWKPGRVGTDLGTIRAKNVIAATHFPIFNTHGGYFMKLYQSRSYVLAVAGGPAPKGMYVDDTGKGFSFRSYGGLLLLGLGGHRPGKKGPGWRELVRFVRHEYGDVREVARWANQDCMSLDDVPYIGPYGKGADGLYVATGFNKWGMTSCMVSAMILTDLVQGRANPFAEVFSPSRSVMRPQLALNSLEAAGSILTPTVPRCPHMGCALKYNASEHSWDCPCHGSRFSETGELLNNPAAGEKRDLPRRRKA